MIAQESLWTFLKIFKEMVKRYFQSDSTGYSTGGLEEYKRSASGVIGDDFGLTAYRKKRFNLDSDNIGLAEYRRKRSYDA